MIPAKRAALDQLHALLREHARQRGQAFIDAMAGMVDASTVAVLALHTNSSVIEALLDDFRDTRTPG